MNGILSLFDSFSSEFSSKTRLINIFPSQFSFHCMDRKCKKDRRAYICKINETTLQILADSKTVVIVSDASIKNQVVTSIAYIHIHGNPIIKTLHHAVNFIFTKAKLFAIRCGINQAIQLVNINHIIIIMNSIHAAKQIFDLSVQLYQV